MIPGDDESEIQMEERAGAAGAGNDPQPKFLHAAQTAAHEDLLDPVGSEIDLGQVQSPDLPVRDRGEVLRQAKTEVRVVRQVQGGQVREVLMEYVRQPGRRDGVVAERE